MSVISFITGTPATADVQLNNMTSIHLFWLFEMRICGYYGVRSTIDAIRLYEYWSAGESHRRHSYCTSVTEGHQRSVRIA